MAKAKKRAAGYRDITLDNIDSPEAQIWLGLLTADQLKAMGSVTLFVAEDGGIRAANPLHVYLDGPEVYEGLPSNRYRWLRPIVGEMKPQYVAWRDGQLWEIEFVPEQETQSSEPSSNEAH